MAGPYDDLIPSKAGSAPSQLDPYADLIPTKQKPKPEGWLEWARKGITGEGKMEFPEAPEFTSGLAGGAHFKSGGALGDVTSSYITSDPAGALDILKKNIPNLQAKYDKNKNLMLKTPAMKEWAYLNKPGLSWRDVDEVLTQGLATLPLLGSAGVGKTIGERVGSGVVFGAGSEIAREAMEETAGSKQKQSAWSPIVAGGLAGSLAPGVPSAAIAKAREAGSWAASPLMSYYEKTFAFNRKAEEAVARAMQEDLLPKSPAWLHDAAKKAQTPEQVAEIAGRKLGDPNIGDMLQEKMGKVGGGSWGEETRLMDIGGENTRALAREAANRSPTARQILNDVINPRYESQASRAMEFIEGLAGENVRGKSRAALKEMEETARSPFYKKAFLEGAEGFTPEAGREMQSSPRFQAALKQAQINLQDKAAAGRTQTSTNPLFAISGPNGYTLEFWNEVKLVLQDRENKLYRQGPSNQAAVLTAMRKKLVAELDYHYPSYKYAREVARGLFEADDALTAGENFVKSKLGNDEAKAAMASMSIQEQEFFRAGYIGRLLDVIKETPDRRNLVGMLAHSPAARERLEIALGPERASELRAFLANEHLMDAIRSAVQGNSTTARQLVELMAGGAAGGLTGFDPMNPITYFTVFLAHRGARAAGLAMDNKFYGEVARVLTTRDPAVYRRGLEHLAQPRWLEALLRLDAAISNEVRQQVIRQAVPQQKKPPRLEPGIPVR
jgi:hypothetical protein